MADSDVEIEERPTSKPCRDCASSIPVAAKKCSVCGSFQGLRRYFTASQSSITLVIALVALFASLSDWVFVTLGHVRDAVVGSRFDMEVAVVRVNDLQLHALIRNRRGHSVAVEGVTCLLAPPVDQGAFALRRIQQNDIVWSNERPAADEALPEIQYVSGLQIRYETALPQMLGPLEERLFSFERIGVGWPGSEILAAEELPNSLCVVTGASRGDPLSAAASILDDILVGSVDAVAFLEHEQERGTDEWETQRLEIIDAILDIRDPERPEE